MFASIPSAPERYKISNNQVNITNIGSLTNDNKSNNLINHYKKILLLWALGENTTLAQKSSISIPILKEIDSSVYDEIKKDFEAKEYYVKNDGKYLTVSQELPKEVSKKSK